MASFIFRRDLINYTYIPERPIFYSELTLREHIKFIGNVEEIPQELLEKRVFHLLRIFKLDIHQHTLLSSFSKGMQQKAMLLLAFITRPDVYTIDEPFIGLDPIASKHLLQFLDVEKQRGAAF